jgi:hypothetical protein
MTDLHGADYRAVRRLSTRDNVTLAEAGETCARVPVESLAPLLASGHIEPVTAALREAAWTDLGRPADEVPA